VLRVLVKNEIQEAIKRCKPNKIAVAYIGADWGKFISEIDNLEAIIISPTLGTNPLAVRDLEKTIGWKKIFFLNELHAKFYLGQAAAVTGSANLTHNGLSGVKLVELCVEIIDKDAIKLMDKIFDDFKKKAEKQYKTTQEKESKLAELERTWGAAISHQIIPSEEDRHDKFIEFKLPRNDYFYVCWCNGEVKHSDNIKKLEETIENELSFADSDDVKANKWILAWNMNQNNTPSKNLNLRWIYIHEVHEHGTEDNKYHKLIIQRNDKALPPHPFELTDTVKDAFKNAVVEKGIAEYLIQNYPDFSLQKSSEGVQLLVSKMKQLMTRKKQHSKQ
jgi:hypothetical protein